MSEATSGVFSPAYRYAHAGYLLKSLAIPIFRPMAVLLRKQAFLVEQARRWDACDIDRLYDELTKVAVQIAALWISEV
jgi:hypothetical protein